jgi:hypothetical protein
MGARVTEGSAELVSGEWVSWLVSKSDNLWGSVIVSYCCEELVAEAGDNSVTQSKGNFRRCKPLPSNG